MSDFESKSFIEHIYFVNIKLLGNTFKYHVSYTDGKISVRIILPIFPPSFDSQVVFFPVGLLSLT